MPETKATIVKEDGVWIIRVPGANGKVQEYRCASESQARQLVIVLGPKQ